MPAGDDGSASSTTSMTSMRLPDFIIAGAMKCGTTSFRNILSHHRDIYIPDHEIFYFALDDIQQHPHFFSSEGREWRYHDVEGRREFYLSWYRSFFAAARADQIVGENSTSYIASTRAPEKIARMLPDAKIILMLRDPVRRAYSHYWHLVRAGRTTLDFEDCLRLFAGNIVERSCYRHQIQRLLGAIPRAQVHFIVFETFLSDMKTTVSDALRFLGVDAELDLTGINTRRNVGRYPRSLKLELLRNRFLGRALQTVPLHLPGLGAPKVPMRGTLEALNRLVRKANPRQATAPPMRPQTKRFLTDYFGRENRGLSDLIGQDVDRLWWKDAR